MIPYLAGLFVAASLHLAWFTTNLPVHLFKTLRALGWRSKDQGFWPSPEDYRDWLRYQWQDWNLLQLPQLVSELLNCPVCLSFHISFWVASIMVVTQLAGFCMIPAALGWPILINVAYHKFFDSK